ncbi:enoyl-CoA hydratase/isomerase family protein [Sphingomonas sp. BK580]|uniref:enoyl-CoA hydratase/isomerase family protein n=1 Tax=Sphingomonas sp. BK580 TaxID=2586972 RepID=UPI0016149112|nr:enoyl-CoA hydratase/isomerase family protein [Sphingomonas sp. BK580]MBB3692937.1 enoyl-CoA hydratase/carnithine racemase [Sphingomonas sp. BK580]
MIALTLLDDVAIVSIERPDARNALPTGAWRALAASLQTLPTRARALLLRSAVPGVFCAGADLADLARLVEDVDARTEFRRALEDAVGALAALPIPTVAAVEGGCFGAGVALALGCDLIVATPAARFGIPPARLGIGYPAGDVARLARRIGRAQAARLLFTAGSIDSAEALRIGLVDMIGDAAKLIDEIVRNDETALWLLKRTLDDPLDESLDQAFEGSFGNPRFAAGVAHYRDKA